MSDFTIPCPHCGGSAKLVGIEDENGKFIPVEDFDDELLTEAERLFVDGEDRYLLLSTHLFQIVFSSEAGDEFESKYYEDIDEAKKDYKYYKGVLVDLGGGEIAILEVNSYDEDRDVVDYDVI